MRIRHLNIEVTKRCNQRCFYCFNDSGAGSPANEFTAEVWLNILRKLNARGLKSVHLTGGEPFAYKDAVKLLAGAQEIGLETSILSNGLRVHELVQEFPTVFRNLVVAQISLDSMDENMHNRRRGHARAWQDATSAISSLRTLKIPVEVSFVLSQENVSCLDEVAEFCERNSASLIIRPIISSGRAASYHASDSVEEDLNGWIQSRKTQVHIVEDRFHYVVDDKQRPMKGVPTNCVTVHSDGLLRRYQNETGHVINVQDLAA